MRGPTVPQAHGKTFVLTAAQVAYNEGVEKALDELIKERNEIEQWKSNGFVEHESYLAGKQVALDNYINKIEALREQYGQREFVAAQV
jgi:hypothetical protein